MTESNKFRAIVNLDDKGEIVCFCPYDDYLRNGCECRDKYDCPEAMIEVAVIHGTKPSDQRVTEVKKASREIKKADREAKVAHDRIKQGLGRLEKAVKSSRWRI